MKQRYGYGYKYYTMIRESKDPKYLRLRMVVLHEPTSSFGKNYHKSGKEIWACQKMEKKKIPD